MLLQPRLADPLCGDEAHALIGAFQELGQVLEHRGNVRGTQRQEYPDLLLRLLQVERMNLGEQTRRAAQRLARGRLEEWIVGLQRSYPQFQRFTGVGL